MLIISATIAAKIYAIGCRRLSPAITPLSEIASAARNTFYFAAFARELAFSLIYLRRHAAALRCSIAMFYFAFTNIRDAMSVHSLYLYFSICTLEHTSHGLGASRLRLCRQRHVYERERG